MSRLNRRAFIRQGLASAFLASSCARAAAPLSSTRTRRRLMSVNVVPDRVIRTIAGLRPFRPAGFVVKAAKYDDKVVVHNYGHGGGGISLSWGSSLLATDLARQTGQTQAAVIGAGVMGLCTARLLQDRGFEVTIYAKELPPNTTSNIAGGQWSPYTVHDADRTTPEYLQQFEHAARLSHRYFQTQAGDRYGVRWIDQYALRDDPFPAQVNPIADLFPDTRELQPHEHPFGARYVRHSISMLVEPFRFLTALQHDFLLRKGKLVIREFRDLRDLLGQSESLIMNCTGLASRTLFDDQALIPIKGQLVFVVPQPEVDYIAIQGDYYMFPRTDGILLGGSRERGEWSTEPTTEVIDRILTGHQAIFGRMKA